MPRDLASQWEGLIRSDYRQARSLRSADDAKLAECFLITKRERGRNTSALLIKQGEIFQTEEQLDGVGRQGVESDPGVSQVQSGERDVIGQGTRVWGQQGLAVRLTFIGRLA